MGYAGRRVAFPVEQERGGGVKPYYEQDGITIYHGRAEDVLLSIPRTGSAVITDPQYGIQFKVNAKRSRKTGLVFGPRSSGLERNPDWIPLQQGDRIQFDPSPLLNFPEIILWGANNYASRLPNSRGWLVWDKLGDKKPCAFGDCELAWTNFDRSIRIWRQLWRGLVREGEDNVANGPKFHPCQKPIELMRWCVEFTTAGTIVDPYMGSGTTLRAAKDCGRRAIGIEIEERYCEIAARRLAQGVLFGAEAS
jgi:site-specific DNA-methyltransferase (adenine-specific)